MIVHDNTRCIRFLKNRCVQYDEEASHLSVTINGLRVGIVQTNITEPRKKLNVFAGDKYLPAAKAKYDNLIWEECPSNITYQLITLCHAIKL